MIPFPNNAIFNQGLVILKIRTRTSTKIFGGHSMPILNCYLFGYVKPDSGKGMVMHKGSFSTTKPSAVLQLALILSISS